MCNLLVQWFYVTYSLSYVLLPDIRLHGEAGQPDKARRRLAGPGRLHNLRRDPPAGGRVEGPTLELLITKLMKVSDAQLIALSATVGDATETEWLGAELVQSDSSR